MKFRCNIFLLTFISTLIFISIFFKLTPAFAQVQYQKLDLNIKIDEYKNTILIEAEVSSYKKSKFTLNKYAQIISIEGAYYTEDRSDITENTRTYLLLNSNLERIKIKYTLPVTKSYEMELKGVRLLPDSYWYPQFGEQLFIFNLKIELPNSWSSISSGHLETISQSDYKTQSWSNIHPMTDINLVAGPFKVYSFDYKIPIHVYLSSENKMLAKEYAELSSQYLEQYQTKIGSYAFDSFSIVEDIHYPSGFGMPGFTLIGSQVLVLPFFKYTSLPHEILHNWWGNSVYVDYDNGNWCEGLTTYQSDYDLSRENKSEYRWSSLKNYKTFVNSTNDYPLSKFLSRENNIDSSIGYNKSMMLQHMLKNYIGSENYEQGLQNFYSKYRFKIASFKDLFDEMALASKKDLGKVYQDWINNTGTTQLSGKITSAVPYKNYWRVNFEIQQNSKLNYTFKLPLHIKDERNKTNIFYVTISERSHSYTLDSLYKPIEISIDPEFEVMRDLPKEENPITINDLIASENISIILPNEATNEQIQLAQNLKEIYSGRQTEVFLDNTIDELPKNSSIWILGKNNKWKDLYLSTVQKTAEEIYQNNKSYVATGLYQNSYLAWTDIFNLEVNKFTQKIPHYGKYSLINFDGPNNVKKETWPRLKSPLHLEVIYDTERSN